ncbi:retroviral-like aspartic protease family protein [Sphingomonas sp. AOB5]|uniref:retroviral-like aspartic protease family protein n=1 Tax=Sphingomonas sp. AOB5 TaxID=3034017 RepID=UPI0023F6DAAD|nr:retroviral-like aspartic protease family protein [Sphingomonas sp. AOB5]MDF7777471.1 retroviral-like aspartic protease family protein [Sphingomonas sp. AOB5]
MFGLRPLLLLALPVAAAAGASTPQDPEKIAPSNEAILLQLGQQDQRLTVPVSIGNSRPYNFIIDTGAERTVVSRQLAGVLDLAPSAPIKMTSMTERSTVDTVIVPELFINSIGQRHTIRAPSLDGVHLGAAGLLGIDTLQSHRVIIDFEKGEMAVMPSRRIDRDRVRDPDEIVVTAKSKYGQLIVTDAYYGDTRIQVILDTGSQVSVGNSALRKRIRAPKRDIRTTRLTSVTGGTADVDYMLVPRIRIGTIRFDWVPIAFADAAPFAHFGLTNRPALLLGMDALRSFRKVEIDFPNRQVRFRMPVDAHVDIVGPMSVAPVRR